MINYQKLLWDSEFFGFYVGKIQDDFVLTENLLQELYGLDFKLLYYSSQNEITNIDSISNKYEIKLVDRKTVFSKVLNKPVKTSSNIKRYLKNYPEPELIELAIESGVYSRFNIDNNIAHSKFVDLYSKWIINSVNKQIAKEVLVYSDNNSLGGFVTVGIKNNRADIGIIAVSSLHRGKGIGKKLVYSAENWALENSIKELQVVTQGNNVPAVKLYEACGYNIESENYIYHLWKK